MKIYKLDIDTSKPIRQVVQMQQNSTGALSVDVSNDGKYIRNLSCTIYDGGTELSAYTTTDVGAGYKVDVGTEPKYVKVVAKSTPMESTKQEIVSYTSFNRTTTVVLDRLVLPVGTYNQDEFLPLLSYVPANNPFFIYWRKSSGSANIDTILFTTANPFQKIWFQNSTEERILEPDEPIIVTEEITFKENTYIRGKNPVLSSDTYPAVGYWTDYSLDTVIRPSENAHCYAEQEVTDPEPDPEPEPTPDPEEPVEPTEG